MKIPDLAKSRSPSLTIICDVSPPRGGVTGLMPPLHDLDADVVSIAYSPGNSVRVDPVAAAAWVKSRTNVDVSFTLATRDMNKIALQSTLLGAQLLGLENLVVVEGDPLKGRDRGRVRGVYDYRPTRLIKAVQNMNRGTDFRGLNLRSPTDFSVGATIDAARDLGAEVELALRKSDSGAEFFLAQPQFNPSRNARFISAFESRFSAAPVPPVFYGVQVLARDGIMFGDIPRVTRMELEAGRSGEEIALEMLGTLTAQGIRDVYLVPPIYRGGRRDYDAAARVIRSARELAG